MEKVEMIEALDHLFSTRTELKRVQSMLKVNFVDRETHGIKIEMDMTRNMLFDVLTKYGLIVAENTRLSAELIDLKKSLQENE